MVFLIVAWLSLIQGMSNASAQDHSPTSEVTIQFRDTVAQRSIKLAWEAPVADEQLDEAWIVAGALEALRREGYWNANISRAQPGSDPTEWTTWGTRGEVCRWGPVFAGEDTLEWGGQYSQQQLEEQIERQINDWESEGYLLASVVMDSIWSAGFNREPCRISARWHVIEGPKLRVGGFTFPDLKHTEADYVQEASGIRDSMLITPSLLRDARLRLEQTELFADVQEPTIVRRDSSYLIRYQLTERNPNRFDILIGYVPNTGLERGGTIVGNADIRLRNLIWEGSDARLHFERLRAEVTKFNLGLQRYWIAGLPLSAGAELHFLQQDSTYQTRNIRLNAGYEILPGATLELSARREIVAANEIQSASDVNEALASGTALDANAWYGGVTLRYERIDRRINPSAGFRLQVQFESGIKEITDERADADSITNRLTPSILSADVHYFQTLWPRHVLAPSIHGYANVLEQFTENDLIRFGGARSLRGYREDQFRAAQLAWGDLEYRYQLDADSYAFLFGSAGYYYRPRLVTESSADRVQRDWLSSYGLGFSYNTRLGQLKFSYAISPEGSFTNGKVHFGIVGSL
jgi:outer membrane protein assembly factor BamA